MTDKFFTQTTCDRCSGPIGQVRQMSWFTEECLCSQCTKEEKELRTRLETQGVDVHNLEGCGYIPKEKLNE